MNKRIITFYFLLSFISIGFKAQDLLQSKDNPEVILNYLEVNQKWVPFLDYYNREAWDKFLGNNKVKLIQRKKNKEVNLYTYSNLNQNLWKES